MDKKALSEVKQQQPTSQKPSEGFLKAKPESFIRLKNTLKMFYFLESVAHTTAELISSYNKLLQLSNNYVTVTGKIPSVLIQNNLSLSRP